MLRKRTSSSRETWPPNRRSTSSTPRGEPWRSKGTPIKEICSLGSCRARVRFTNNGSWPLPGMTKGWAVIRIDPGNPPPGRQPARDCPSGRRSREARQCHWPFSGSLRVTLTCFKDVERQRIWWRASRACSRLRTWPRPWPTSWRTWIWRSGRAASMINFRSKKYACPGSPRQPQ